MEVVIFILFILMVMWEVSIDGHYGDKHDFISGLILALVILAAEGLGLIMGTYFGSVIYLLIRLALFDITFGFRFRIT